jgi:hypothetical protein
MLFFPNTLFISLFSLVEFQSSAPCRLSERKQTAMLIFIRRSQMTGEAEAVITCIGDFVKRNIEGGQAEEEGEAEWLQTIRSRSAFETASDLE